MRLELIAWNNLRRRRSRVAFLVAGLLLGVATLVALVSLMRALGADAQHELEQFGANIIITPRSENLALTYGGLALGGVTFDARELPAEQLAAIRTIPNRRNIAAVAPKTLGAVNVADQRALLMGVDPQVEFGLKRWWRLEGRPLAAPDELVAGRAAAARLGLALEQEVTLADATFRVVGILEETGSQDDQLLIVELGVAQRLLGKPGQVSLVEVAALCADCPVEEMVQQIAAVLPDGEVRAIQQVVRSRMHALEQLRTLSLAVAAVVLLIGGLVVFVTMMNSVNERVREIGIFRALGFRRGHVMRLFLTETAVVALAAGLLGYLAGEGVAAFARPFFSNGAHGGGHHAATLPWDPTLAAGAVLLALVVGTLATLFPAWKASRLEPSEALRSI